MKGELVVWKKGICGLTYTLPAYVWRDQWREENTEVRITSVAAEAETEHLLGLIIVHELNASLLI
jgi:hypothetical protein